MCGVYPGANASTSSAAGICGVWMAWRKTIMHATGLTSRTPRGSHVQGLPFQPFVKRCMGAVCGEREGHAEVRRCSIAPGR
jgi:hypothetical protein